MERLEALPVAVKAVEAHHRHVRVAGYGGRGRPTAVIRVEGGGRVGRGEFLAWTAEEQVRFVERAPHLTPRGRGRTGDFAHRIAEATSDPYERAALELATIDLALHQNGTNLFKLADLAPRPVPFLVSLATLTDPAGELRALLRSSPGTRFKLDVDPRWADSVWSALAGHGTVVVLDLKLRGGVELAERAHAALPEALLEDPNLAPSRAAAPLSRGLARRLSFDAPLRSASDVEHLPFPPAVVNVKPGRLGGLLEALRTFEVCERLGIRTYVGGMFEVGPGRSQVQVLASLFSPREWNDVAPLPAPSGRWPASPLRIPPVFTGLGFA